MPRETYQVTINRPDGVTITEMKEFIRDELQAAGGHRPLEDELHDVGEVRVIRVA